MKRKVLAGLLSFAMVFSLMPSTPVFAEEDVTNTSQIETQADGQEQTSVENETQQEETKMSDSVTELQNRIASLPTVEEFKSSEKEKQDEIYNEAQAISDEYDKLSEVAQGQVDTSKLEALFEYFNSMTAETATTISPVTSGSKSINSGGTYTLKGGTYSTSYHSIIINTTDAVTLNIDGNITATASSNAFIRVKSACNNLTINGNGKTIDASQILMNDNSSATVTLNNCVFKSSSYVTVGNVGTIYVKSGSYSRTGSSGQVFSNADGTLYIQGGTITNVEGTNDAVAAGNVYMTGGTVSAPKGGGIRLSQSGTKAEITGGTISGSKYGVYLKSGNPTCKIGNVTFSGNTNDVYLASGHTFTLSTDYAGVSNIKVGVADSIGNNTKRQITTTGTAQSMLAKVSSVNSAYTVNYDTSGKYLYLWKHAHTWSYSASENTITAKCTSDSKCGYYSTGLTATLNIEESVPYSGKAYDGASVTNNITSVTGASAGSIKYVGRDGTSYTESTTAPTNAGKYTAKVTIGGKTATADFEITKAKVTAPTADSTKFVYTGTKQTYTVADSDLYTVSNNTRTKAGKQTVTVSLKDKVNSEWADGTTDDVTFDFEIAKLSVAKPAKDTTAFVYNGKAQTYTVADSQYYTVDGNVRTDAGKQTVTITLKDTDNTEWKDGTVKEIAYDFEIAKLQVAKPTANTKSFVYNKQEQEYELANSDYYEITNNKRTNAGYQMVKVALKDTANTEWKDGTQDALSFKFEIGKANPEVNVTMATDLVYNGSEQPLVTAGTTSGGTLKYQLNGGDWTTEIPTAKDAGTYTVKYKVVGDDNYNDGIETTEKVTIKKADLSVTESTYSGTYDGESHEVGVTATPSAKITYKTSADSDYTSKAPSFKDAGTYTVDYKIVKDNYNTVTGTLTVVIDKKTVKVSGITANGKTYDGTTNATVNCDNAVFDGIIGNDKLTVTANGTFDSKDAGERTVTLDKLTLGGADSKNYQLADSDNQTTTTATITPKDGITAVITPNGGVYGGTITGATAVLKGLVGEDNPEIVLTYTGTANDGTEYNSTEVPTLAGTYKVTATITDGNYILEKSEAPFEITKMQVTKPTENTKSFVYNTQEQEYELVNSDYYEITNNKRTNAGYQMVKVALKDTANTEWKDGSQDALSFKFEIGKANPEVNVTMATDLVYNGSEQPLVTAGTTSGGTLKYQLNGGDWTTEIPTAKDAGTYTVKYKVFGDDNYNDGIETTEKVTIAKADLKVTESTYSGTYDGKSHEVGVTATPSATITYKQSTDDKYTSEAPSFKDAGTYTVDYKVVKDNYNTVTGTLTVVIDKKTVKVSGITANGKTYDGTTNATVNCDNAVFDGIIGNDKLTVTANGTFDSKDAGERTVTLDKLTLGGADLKNYQLADSDNQTTTTATITAKTVTATITANGGVYGGTITGATATINGLVGEEQPEVVLTYTGKANDGTDYSSTEVPTLAGTYTVTATVTDGNYNLAKSETEFVINRANPNLSVSAVPDKNYGDNTFALEVSHDGDGTLSFASDKEKVATVDADGNVTIKGAGTAKLTVTLAESANYTAGTADVTIKVAKTPHGMTVDSIKYEKTYGDTPFAVTATADDSESNITYTSSDESVATVDENGVVTIHKAGTAEITVAMAESDNHTAVSTKITVDVKAKPVTVKAKDTSKTYGDNEPELGYEVLNDGLVEGDSLADVTVTRENGEDVKDGGYVMTATADKTANPNYDITFETGTFIINPKDISNATVALGTALKYTGKEQTQDIKTITVDGIEVPADSYEVTGNTATEAGVYTLTITAKDGSNFTGTKTWTYVVAPTKTEQIKENEDGKIELGNGTVTIAVKADDNAPKTTLVTGKAEIIDMLVKSGDITADELTQIANGASVDIVLTVKDASATVSNEAKSAMTDTASKAGYTIGQYIDISLYKYMTVDGVTDDGVQLHSTADKVKIAVQIPDSLINKDSKVNRTYYIIRYHDGKAEIIEGTYDEATHTFTFETDKFSDYAIAYKDVKVADKTTNATDNGKKPSATKSVKTGDTSNLMLYSMTLLLSMMGIVLILIRRRKSER